MGTPRTRSSRVFTISFPEPLARQVDEIAREENQNISELFRQAFRMLQAHKMEKKLEKIQRSLPPTDYTPDDIVGLVHEIRREMWEARRAREFQEAEASPQVQKA